MTCVTNNVNMEYNTVYNYKRPNVRASDTLTILKYQSQDLQLKIPSGEFVLRFFTSSKITLPLSDLDSRTLGLEARLL